MGDSGPAHQVGTFSGCADDLHAGKILQVAHMRFRLHVVSISIVLDWDPKFLREFPESHGDVVDDEHCFTSIDGRQSERTIQILEDMLQAYVLDIKGNWEEHLPLVEFSYNNSYQCEHTDDTI